MLNFSKNKNKNRIIKPTNYGITKKVMLITNARDEKRIKEWVSHHLLIGFDLILIFDHKSNPPLNNTLHNFDQRVKVLRCEDPNPVKLNLMNASIDIAKSLNVDWFIYLDADEFLILNRFRGVKQMLNYYNHTDSLAINWLLFGTNNLINEPSGLILENYTKSQLLLDKHVKSFIRPNEAINATNPHFYNIRNRNRMFHISNKIMNPQNYAFHDTKQVFYESPAYIAHYIYQSEETYMNRKIKLPRDDNGMMRGVKDPNLHKNYNDVTNLQPKKKYSEIVNKFLQSKL
jgi:hypothetical protein